MNVALLGFGTVGSSFYELAKRRTDLKVTYVLSRHLKPEITCITTTDMREILRDPTVDIVVEAIGGLHPAYEYVCDAIRAGKHIVTANKHMMVAYFDELLQLAQEYQVCIRCTAAAAGGIPWLTAVARAARIDELVAVEGILNGTTNHILTAMSSRGVDYATALQEAQRAGLAEADPTADVEAWDPMRKLVLSINLAFGVSVREAEIRRFGISSIQAADIAAFRKRGLICKLFNRAEKMGDGVISAFVMPTLFTQTAFQTHVNVSLYGRHIGRQSFSAAGIGPKPSAFSTGSSVLGDCLDIIDGCSTFYYLKDIRPCVIDNSNVYSQFYYRVGDRTGITERMNVDTVFAKINELRQEYPQAFFARLCDSQS